MRVAGCRYWSIARARYSVALTVQVNELNLVRFLPKLCMLMAPTSWQLRLAMRPNCIAQALLIWLLAVLAAGPASAQRRDRTIFQFQHTSWTVREGVPSAIMKLAQTTDGYLWLANAAGLYRFDGIHFERYQPPPGQEFK